MISESTMAANGFGVARFSTSHARIAVRSLIGLSPSVARHNPPRSCPPSDAFSIAWLIERYGLTCDPHVALSAPSLVTLSSAATAGWTPAIMNATKKIHDFAIGNPFHSSLIGRFARTLARPPRRPNTYIHRKVAAIYIQDIASRRSDGADACPAEDVVVYTATALAVIDGNFKAQGIDGLLGRDV